MLSKTLALIAFAAVASAQVAYLDSAHGSIGAQAEHTLHGFGGLSSVSKQTKAVDSPYSSVRKTDIRVTNDAYASPAFHGAYGHAGFGGYAAPIAHGHGAYGHAHLAHGHGYAAPAYGHAGHGYAAPALAHGYAHGGLAHGYAAPALAHGYAGHGYAAPALAHGYAGHGYAAPALAHHAGAYAAPLAHAGAYAAAPAKLHSYSPATAVATLNAVGLGYNYGY